MGKKLRGGGKHYGKRKLGRLLRWSPSSLSAALRRIHSCPIATFLLILARGILNLFLVESSPSNRLGRVTAEGRGDKGAGKSVEV